MSIIDQTGKPLMIKMENTIDSSIGITNTPISSVSQALLINKEEDDISIQHTDKEAQPTLEDQSGAHILWGEGSTNDELLINAVKSRAALWDSRESLYRNRTYKAILWKEVAKEMCFLDIPKNISLLKRRWDNLRTRYFRHKRLVQTHWAEGLSTKPYKYAEISSFLDETVCIYNESTQNNIEDNSNADSSCSTSERYNYQTTAKRKNEIENEESEQILEHNEKKFKANHIKVRNELKSSNHLFGEMLAIDLDKLPSINQYAVKIKILEIIQQEYINLNL